MRLEVDNRKRARKELIDDSQNQTTSRNLTYKQQHGNVYYDYEKSCTKGRRCFSEYMRDLEAKYL